MSKEKSIMMLELIALHEGMTLTEHQIREGCQGIGHATFLRVRYDLLHHGYIICETTGKSNTYYLTPDGEALLTPEVRQQRASQHQPRPQHVVGHYETFTAWTIALMAALGDNLTFTGVTVTGDIIRVYSYDLCLVDYYRVMQYEDGSIDVH